MDSPQVWQHYFVDQNHNYNETHGVDYHSHISLVSQESQPLPSPPYCQRVPEKLAAIKHRNWEDIGETKQEIYPEKPICHIHNPPEQCRQERRNK